MNRSKLFLFVFIFLFSGVVWAQDHVHVWSGGIGGELAEVAQDIAVDPWENVYTIGTYNNFNQSVDFDPGPGVVTLNTDLTNTFIHKLHADGSFAWVRSLNLGSSGEALAVAADAEGAVYIAGHFRGIDIDLNPGPDTTAFTGFGNDIFILKLDSSGAFEWAKTIGSSAAAAGDWATDIAIDRWGNILVTGFFRRTNVDFDPGPGTANLSSNGSTDAFILKLDHTGAYQWAKKIGASGTDAGWVVEADDAGAVYVAGRFNGKVDFDPGSTVFQLSSAFSDDMFVLKLDSTGGFEWAVNMGGAGDDFITAIDTKNPNAVYVTGTFESTVDFDPGPGTSNLTNPAAIGTDNAFILKLNTAGAFQWVRQIGGTTNVQAEAIVADNQYNIYTTGNFVGTVDFDPGSGTSTLFRQSGTHLFVQKLDSAGQFQWVKALENNASASSASMVIDSTDDLYLTGVFANTADFDPDTGVSTLTSASPGFNDVFMLKLRACTTSTTTDTVTACDSYQWIDGITYTTSTTNAVDTLISSLGCDSIVNLDLTLNLSSARTDAITACNSYTWINGQTYTASTDTATYILTNNAGCDSVITLDLTLNTVDASVTTIGFTLTADMAGATYQWLDCANSFAIIPNETNQSLTVTTNGSYAVEVSMNGCQDTSNCIQVTNVGVDEQLAETNLLLYPSPVDDSFVVESTYSLSHIQVFEPTGKLVLSQAASGGKIQVSTAAFDSGIYLIKAFTDRGTVVSRLVVQH